MQKRIEKITTFFKGFNITDGIAYVVVSFPKTWQIPSGEVLSTEFKVSVAEDEGGTYFFTQYTNGIELVFDAVDFVIEFNRDLELKTNLFKEKMDELKRIFMSESLETLKTLKIEFKQATKKTSRKKNVSKKVNKVDDIVTSEVNTEDIKLNKEETTITESNGDSMLDFVMSEVSEQNENK